MVRLVLYLVAIALVTVCLGWLADRPGTLHMVWLGLDIETSVFHAIVILAATIATGLFLWSLFTAALNSPAIIGQRLVRRRQKKGLDALSSGLIAIGAGDSALAARYALLARRSLPHEPLTHLLRAQAADLAGDRITARRIYEAMLASPETEQLGLRGLFLEAEREHADEAAKQYAGRALTANSKLGWSSNALFHHQCKQKDWAGALDTLEHARKNGHVGKAAGDRQRAVLLTARATELEENAADKALPLAIEAHALAPDLIPAAALAGRVLASKGSTGKAAKVLQRTWARAPHPDLATAYAYARVGDSTRDRFDRIRQLAALNPNSIEGPIAVATVAIDARMFDEARQVLEPLLADRLTHRIAMLMARIEAGDNGDKGRVREWLARASHAPRDPVWIADGVISDNWEATSPRDGRLDAFQWIAPRETRDASRTEILARRLEELIALGSPLAGAPPATEMEDVGEGSDPLTAEATAIVAEAVEEAPVTKPVESSRALRPVAEPRRKDSSTEPARGTEKRTANGTAEADPRTEVTKRTTSEERRSKRTQKPEPESYDAGHAPDDPGVDAPEPELEQPVARRSFRSVN